MEQTRDRQLAAAPGTTALRVTRVLSAIMAALVLVQGASAGTYLEGVSGALAVHSLVAMPTLAVLSIAVAVFAIRAARAKRWVLGVAVLAFLGVNLQIAMGYARFLQIHVPLGIALFGTYLSMALLAKSPKQK
jgi:membrane protein YdbS with pleckstrin-like domain